MDGGRRISDFERQLAADTFLFLVTIEPTKRTALSTVRGLDRYGAHGRYTMLQSACSTHETPRTLTFYEHPDSQCNSLHPDNPLAVKVDAGKCVGGRSQSTSVPVVTLNQVLLRIPRVLSIPLLKIDTQGNEWACLLGAGSSLKRIDNIFIEIQDLLNFSLAMYEGSHDARFYDAHLGEHGFERQYCEFNGKLGRNSHTREVNCMYTQRFRNPLLMTNTASGEAGVEPWRGTKPAFHRKWSLTTLASTPQPGALDSQLRALGLQLVLLT